MTTPINNLLDLIDKFTKEVIKKMKFTLKAGTGRRIVEFESLAIY
jgi:hypothetical protein